MLEKFWGEGKLIILTGKMVWWPKKGLFSKTGVKTGSKCPTQITNNK